MGLKIRLRNLGILKQAEFSLGDLTIICGKITQVKLMLMHYGFFKLEMLRSKA